MREYKLLKGFAAQLAHVRKDMYITERPTRVHTIDATGDVCVGDEVIYLVAEHARPYSKSSKRYNPIVGYTVLQGRVLRDSYGRDKQQHTFTVQLPDGSEKRVKGRVLYRYGTWRKPWADESARQVVLADKHKRGAEAREAAWARKEEKRKSLLSRAF